MQENHLPFEFATVLHGGLEILDAKFQVEQLSPYVHATPPFAGCLRCCQDIVAACEHPCHPEDNGG
ncbi:hypothetical protein GCM10009733_105450 [Nonomuraea maheshkhaliensis]|uniref:Uncharacterized protein n=1 Tax=Nonomuraea maheshkhaliensis TaxID=419590 RepID=A0ABP4TQU3_9ACTN